ncbi:MAG: hypothetical protein M3Y86_05420 [Verrucomicrobiota bacterium]|nr:hypothetical protein [Verrucomicrobiota bacterium]
MAKEHRPAKSLHDLRQEIAHSRDRLARDLTGLGYELNFPLKFKKSFQRQSKLWIAGAVLIGVVVTVAGGGRKKIIVQHGGSAKKGQEQKKGMLAAGLAMGAFRLVATLARPLVMSLITKKLRGYASGAGVGKWR